MTAKSCIFLIALAATSLAQNFDAASIKAIDPKAPPMFGTAGGPGSATPGRFRSIRTTLYVLLMKAWNLQSDQLIGPDWLRDFSGLNLYDVIATMPPDTTQENFQRMLQNLLTERFQLKVHHETRDFPGYDLTVAPGGPKLKPTPLPDPKAVPTPPLPDPNAGLRPLGPLPMPVIGPDGFMKIAPGPGQVISTGPGQVRDKYQERSVPEFAASLGTQLSRALRSDPNPNAPQPRVQDKTGLTGRYDFTLEFDCLGCQGFTAAMRANMPLLAGRGGDAPAPDVASDPGSGLPNVFVAIEKQLGLKLTKTKDVPVDVLVIDHAEKIPTEN